MEIPMENMMISMISNLQMPICVPKSRLGAGAGVYFAGWLVPGFENGGLVMSKQGLVGGHQNVEM